MASSENRPLSPHIQVYRWQITMTMSILHRATGIALAFGTLLLAYWLIAAAAGPEAFALAQQQIGSWFGQLLLFGWSYALFYHLCNGIRHLAWDAGWGFELGTMAATGWFVVFVSVLLTVLSWVLGYMAMGWTL